MAALLKFYSAWFCPYAQRTWITLNHLNIGYELIESLNMTPNGYVKNEDLLRLNPKGLVPTLDVNGEVVVESLDTIEFLNRKFNNNDGNFVNEQLMKDALCVNKTVCSPFYQILMKQEQEERDLAWDEFAKALKDFTADVQQGGFFKSSTMNIVDITVLPWACRLFLIEHYRGKCLDETQPWVGEFVAWRERMLGCKGVRETIADDGKLKQSYARYADGTAKSKVGDAVRSGDNAHDV